jgi:hypothetical protein
MSRSYRRSLVFPNGKGTYEHEFKHKAQRSLRRNNRVIERKVVTGEEDDPLFYELREVSDVWCFPKDGKRYSPLDWIVWLIDGLGEQLRIWHKTVGK